MAFNLIDDAWLPVRRRSGWRGLVAPAAVAVAGTDDPVVALASPRADFDGALGEFLVGLLSTAAAPADLEEWLDGWHEPPDSAALQRAFAAVRHAFDLEGDGARAFQDLDPLEDADELPVERLLIEAPGDQALRNNTDLFVRRNRATRLGRAAAAAALIPLQTYAPSGGRGHRTSLRGGGPLTTLVVPDEPVTLWYRLWANVPTREKLKSLNRADDGTIFPWLSATRISPKGEQTMPGDAHYLQVFWGLPRRLRLVFDDARQEERCDLYGIADEVMVRGFRARPFGTNYEGGWVHHLTPHYSEMGKLPMPRHAGPGGVSYRHWLGLVQGLVEERSGRQPAACVADWQLWRGPELPGVGVRLRAFGYDMDNMKARCWYESEMPLLSPPAGADHDAYAGQCELLVLAAQDAASLTVRQIKVALFDRPGDVRGDFSLIDDRFWRRSEPAFFEHLRQLDEVLDDAEQREAWRARWRDRLLRTAAQLFDEEVNPAIFQAERMARVVAARRNLVRGFHGRGPVAKRLDLVAPRRQAA